MIRRRPNSTFRRQAAAAVCLLAFVVGGVVAPAAHYGFMAVSGGPVHHEQGMAPGDGHRMAVSMPDHAGAGLERHTTAHELCQYADLFASFAPTFIDGQTTVGQLDVADILFPSVELSAATELVSTSFARGPPSAPIAA